MRRREGERGGEEEGEPLAGCILLSWPSPCNKGLLLASLSNEEEGEVATPSSPRRADVRRCRTADVTPSTVALAGRTWPRLEEDEAKGNGEEEEEEGREGRRRRRR
jgi:hypothetical protein